MEVKCMSKNKQRSGTREVKDWREQLADFKETLPGGDSKKSSANAEKKPRPNGQNNFQRKKDPQRLRQEIPHNEHMDFLVCFVYAFMAGYKQNSGIYVNNLLRGRNFKEYVEAIFDAFTMDFFGTAMPNDFGDLERSFAVIHELDELSRQKIAYYQFDDFMAQQIIALDSLWRALPKTAEPVTVYRGCNSIEKNGLNGIVSTTTDIRIARQFSRGTVICAHLPAGFPFIDINSLRQYHIKGKDKENEVIIPPCAYRITSKKFVEKRNEPNNIYSNKTLLIDATVTGPLDLLEETLKILKSPPEEYYQHYVATEPDMHAYAIHYIEEAIRRRGAI